MAIGDPTVRTTVSQKSSANPWTGAAIESQINAGEYAVAILASDNIGGEAGVDGASTRSFLSDSQGNYWQKVAEYTDEAAAGSGESVSVFVSKISRTLTTSDTFAAHFLVSGNRTLGAKGLIVLAGSIGAGKRLRAETTLNQFAAGAVDPASSALAALTSREHLYLRAISYCGPDTVILTPTAGYTAVGANGSGSGTTGAAANTNKTAIAEWKKATSTGDTSDPATNTDLAHANIFCALWEDNEWTGPTFIGIGTPATGVAAVSPGIPVGWAVDDIFVLAAECNSGETVTVAGWTQFPDSPQDASAGTRLTLLWKRAAAGETAPTTNDPGDHIYTVIFGIRGCPTTGNPFDVTSGNNEGATLDTSVSVTGDTTTVTNTLVAVLTAHGFDIGTDGSTMFTSWVNADLALLEERWDGGTQQGTGGGLGILTGEKASAGSYAASTATSTSSTGHANMTVAFKAGKVVSVGQVTETDISQQIKRNPQKRLLPQLVETDISAAMGKAKSRVVGDSASVTPPATAVDNFNRANQTGLGTPSGGGFTWAILTGSADIVSNEAYTASTGGSNHLVRAEVDMPSANHYAQMEYRSAGGTTEQVSVFCRFYTSLPQSWYRARYDPLRDKCIIEKSASGILTEIATEAGTHALVAGDTIRLECNGNSHQVLFNGVQHAIVTDSLLPSYLRTGFQLNTPSGRDASSLDNFSAGALSVAGHLIEENVAQKITSVRTEPAAQVVETDVSRFVKAPVKVNRAIETDVVAVVARPKIVNLGRSTENDICITEWPGYGEAYQGISIRERKSRTLAQVLETDISRPVTKLGITRIPTQVVETDIATAITRQKLRSVLQVLETDISTAMAKRKTKLFAQVVETDISAVMTRTKLKSFAQVVETDISTAMVKRKTKLFAQVIETDLSRPITRPLVAIPVAQALETDISAVVRKMLLVDIEFVAENDTVDPFFKRKSKAIGMTTETDVPFAIAKRLKTQYVNQVAETDIANLTGRLKKRVVAQSLETNIATALLKTKLKAVAQALETDLGTAMLAIRGRTVSQAVEADISSQMTRRKTKVFAQAVETDLATLTTRLKRKTFGQVIETDVSQPIKWKVTRFVNRAIETDLATAMAHLKQKLVQQVIETDISTAMLKRKLKVLAQAIETDLGQIISRQKLKVFGQAIETDLSRLILYAETRPVNRVTETDIAFAIKKLKQRLFNQVVETDIAQHLGTAFQLGVQQVTESDFSQPMVRLKKRILGQPFETDLAQISTHVKNLLAQQAIESDLFATDLVAPAIEAVQGLAGSTFTNIQSPTMPNGSNVVGKILVAIICPAVPTITFTWPAGWVPFKTTTPPSGPKFAAAYHIVDGTEGWDGTGDTITLTFSASSRYVGQVFRLPANVPMPPECEVAFQQDFLDDANPPMIFPAGGLKPYLLICGFAASGWCTGDVAPTGYGGLLVSTHGATTSGRASMTTAYKTATTASDDPDVFGTANGDGTNDGTTFTIAIQPVEGKVLRVLKSKTLSQTAETDIARGPITKRKLKVVGQSLETDAADVLGLGESVIVGKATENDLARIASKALGVHLLQATESDLAALLRRVKRRGSGQAIENDIARFLTSGFSTPLDTAVETDLSFALKQVRAKIITRAIETDQTTPLILLKYKTIGQAVEYDLAFALLVAPFAPHESVITDATPEAVLTDVTPVAFLIETPVSELTDLVPIVVFVLSTPEAIITGVESVPKALSREEVEMSLLRMIRGESAEWDVLVRHPITKQPINLTGKGLRFMAKREYDDENASAIIDVTTPSAITIVDPTGGLAHIKVPSASTLDLDNERTRLVYEFEVTSGADKSKSDSGYLVVNPQVVLP